MRLFLMAVSLMLIAGSLASIASTLIRIEHQLSTPKDTPS